MAVKTVIIYSVVTKVITQTIWWWKLSYTIK